MKSHPHAGEPSQTVTLGAGDFYFGGGRTRISTLLGSCVSITLWNPRRRIGGMCHFMLTERQRPQGAQLDGRYASEAFALFLEHVEQAGTQPSAYQAKLFGGANMFSGGSGGQSGGPSGNRSGGRSGGGLDIGARNIEYAKRLLTEHHIALVAEHVAGSGRRKLHFDVWSGDVWLAFPDGAGAEVRTVHGVCVRPSGSRATP